MPQRPGSYYHSAEQFGHSTDARLRRAASAASAGTIAASYTLAHAGRQLRLGPIAFWIVVGTLVIMAIWTITTATYFAFREDVLTRLIAREAEMQFGYEDRIAELRAQVDRMSSRQLLDQEQFEQKLDQILRRQTALEQRSSTLGTLPDVSVTGSTRPAARSEPIRAPLLRPAPLNDSSIPSATPGRKTASVETVLGRLSASLDRIEAQQSATLQSIEQSYDAKARRIRGVLTELGVEAGKAAPAAEASATGGPFVAARLRPDAGAFDRQIYRVSLARAQVDRLTRTLGNVPIRRPVTGEADLSSGFGMRIDPFLRSPAMHTGMDMRGETGDPVHATANGTVTIAGWQGGYGKMVEIDHGNGLATRYGHLSSIDVDVGKTVRTGQVIGKVGTTGRSTGPHLHYETRVDGEAVDPQKFLRAGARLAQ
jgi:murein DD-endopeptidase MepM/ murein hydrolase activator NlpD